MIEKINKNNPTENDQERLESLKKEVENLSTRDLIKKLIGRGQGEEQKLKGLSREELEEKLVREESLEIEEKPKKIDWLRGKLQEFKQAREGLVVAEANRKKFEGIKRVLTLKQGTKAGAKKEYENAKQEYDLKRAEYIGEHVGRKLKEQTKLADLRAEEFNKEKGWGRKFYEGYKKLGEWNVGKLLGEKVMGKLETNEGDSKLMRFAKGTGRFFTKSLSVRTALSFSMLGAGV
ncbi:hypothetical protein IID20_04340, partial [Patescibacteria group bacterium]|nr:hypothetical protein [Patescibacteria group bacterium]